MTVLQHLDSRYLNTNLHRVWVDEAQGVATFPLWNLSGQFVGYQQYRPNADKQVKNNPRQGRYFTRVKDARVGVWGLESWRLSNTLFITEGVFDAARITYTGRFAAIALLSYDVSHTTRTWLWTVRRTRKVVAICDNDSSGLKLAKYGHVAHVVNSGDLGDASEQYVSCLIKNYVD